MPAWPLTMRKITDPDSAQGPGVIAERGIQKLPVGKKARSALIECEEVQCAAEGTHNRCRLDFVATDPAGPFACPSKSCPIKAASEAQLGDMA